MQFSEKAEYGKLEYWERRYRNNPEAYDFFFKYEHDALGSLLDEVVPRSAAILVPGCGNSRLSEDMLTDGYMGGISNVDFSQAAIDLVAERVGDRAGLACACARRRRAGAGRAPTARARSEAPCPPLTRCAPPRPPRRPADGLQQGHRLPRRDL